MAYMSEKSYWALTDKERKSLAAQRKYAAQQKAADAYIARMQASMSSAHTETVEQSITHAYGRPNGGNRTLPYGYGKLTTEWVSSTGQRRLPTEMNQGHLLATLQLLNESHGNVIDRATRSLGAIACHMQNHPAIVEALHELCLEIQKVEVDDMYPIFGPLADALKVVVPEVTMAFEDTIAVGNW